MKRRGEATKYRLRVPVLSALLLAFVSHSHVQAASRTETQIEAALRADIQQLASDDFEGREPGTPGEAKTLRYLGRQWFDIGLVSGTNDPGHEWFSPVTILAREPASQAVYFIRKGRRITLPPSMALVVTSGKRSLTREAPTIFAGYGDGPGLGRNEVAGRAVLLLDSGSQGKDRQNALLNAGAAAVITILDGERTLESVTARRQRTGYVLESDATSGDLEAFVTPQAVDMLLRGGSLTLDNLKDAATKSDFVPIALDLMASLEATNSETRIQTHNLIGKLPGKRSASGAVLFLAHWDAFGSCGEPPAEDLICNGAVDNASGVAALTEIARRLSRAPQMDRDIYFLATTSEEIGLLGAHAFAENPPLPLKQIVAAFNLDSVAIAPAGTPVAIVGRGMTPLDNGIAKVVRQQRRRLVNNDEANAYVRRQDGWALLQHDIPTVMVSSAYGDLSRMEAFFEGDYHRPSDDLSRAIELGGAAQDVLLHVALGRWFADVRRAPANPASQK